MRKNFKRLFALSMATLSVFGLAACGDGKNTNNGNQGDKISAVSSVYETVLAPMQDGLIVLDSATDGVQNYYVIDVAVAKNVPIWAGMDYEYSDAEVQPPVMDFSEEKVAENTIEKSISETISTTFSHTDSHSFGIEVGAEFEICSWFKLSVKGSHTSSWEDTQETSRSTTSAKTTAESIAQSHSAGFTSYPGGKGFGVYRYAMLATCDVYAMLETNLTNTKTLKITYMMCPRKDARLKVEYRPEDKAWGGDSKPKDFLPDNYLSLLPAPKNQVDETTYTMALENTSINISDHKSTETYQGNESFKIIVPAEFLHIVDSGCLYIDISVKCKATLQYRSSETEASATIKACFDNEAPATVSSLKAKGGGWPWNWVDPAYGEEVTDENSALQGKYLMDSAEKIFTMNYQYIINFDVFQNWAGGTHAVNFSCEFSEITYKFYTK